MNPSIDTVYEKIKQLDRSVKENLRKQGVVIPKKYKDGSIGVGHFRIIKERTGFYSILDYRNEAVIEGINLPQTAAVLANRMALGKFFDDVILNNDRRYGHALFDETLHIHLAERNIKKNKLDEADLFYTKAKISKYKKDRLKAEINSGYEKLFRFR
jgi:hypothetical protein